ncbi:hypothetical protein PR048_004962 [Dryococelus australis]|uniref:Uncharacterized protein n=1 Tax=Dryococelus australis TaxID=614101 RepID=A0ABQ9I6V5_9NEOP|nr:hypothetical protein PR048_004962 [Dryococelus australis]
MKRRGKWDIHEKTRRPAASSGSVPTCVNPRATPLGIEPAVILPTSHQGEPGSITGRVTPDFRKCELCRTMPQVGGLSRGSPVSRALRILALPHSHVISLSSAPKTSLLRAAQISQLNSQLQFHLIRPAYLALDNIAGWRRGRVGMAGGAIYRAQIKTAVKEPEIARPEGGEAWQFVLAPANEGRLHAEHVWKTLRLSGEQRGQESPPPPRGGEGWLRARSRPGAAKENTSGPYTFRQLLQQENRT